MPEDFVIPPFFVKFADKYALSSPEPHPELQPGMF